jgi:hypothetical protein
VTKAQERAEAEALAPLRRILHGWAFSDRKALEGKLRRAGELVGKLPMEHRAAAEEALKPVMAALAKKRAQRRQRQAATAQMRRCPCGAIAAQHSERGLCGRCQDEADNPEPLVLDRAELDLLRQWYDAVSDLNHKYLEPADHALYARIMAALGR